MSCGQAVPNNSAGKTWSAGTLVFGGSNIESDQDEAYYRAVDNKFPAEENDTEVYVQDPKNGRSHIFIHPFMGRLKTELLSTGSYQLTGKIRLPNDGNWKADFIDHTAFEIKLNFTEEGWRLYDFINDKISLSVNYPRLDSIRILLENNSVASSKNWGLTLTYFELIEQYEYDLLTAVLAGNSTVLEEYLLFQRNYNIAYAGEFSEYYTGNIFYLLCRGIIGPEDLKAVGTYNDFAYLQRVYGT